MIFQFTGGTQNLATLIQPTVPVMIFALGVGEEPLPAPASGSSYIIQSRHTLRR